MELGLPCIARSHLGWFAFDLRALGLAILLSCLSFSQPSSNAGH